MPRFDKTSCSQCGGEFGPGDQGYSHCEDHAGACGAQQDVIRAAVAAMPNVNPGVADDLIQGHAMHIEVHDIVALWQSASAKAQEELTNAYAEGRKDEAEESEKMRRALGDIISQTVVNERMGYSDPQVWAEKSARIRQIARGAL